MILQFIVPSWKTVDELSDFLFHLGIAQHGE